MRNFSRRTIGLILLIALLTLAFGVVTNLISNGIPENFTKTYFPHLCFSAVLVAVLIGILTTDIGKQLFISSKDNSNPKPEDITHFYAKIKEYLTTHYQNRLDQKLAKRHPVNLRRLPSFVGDDDVIAAYVPYGSGVIQETMAQTFREAKGRLLLIGTPGAGKTSLLLQLVLDLLETEQEALPAIINLATWTNENAELETWLREILPAELGVNKVLATQILLDNRLILLFDGLDEVKEEYRQSCLEAIGRYGMDAKRRFVITSRMEEYKLVEKDAPVNLQVEVGPLTIEQVEKSLAEMGYDEPEAIRLYFALQEDPMLREAVQTPFYLNTLQLMFATGKTWSDLKFLNETLEGRQWEIVERFVEEALAVPVKEAIMLEQERHWLAFWASRLKRENLVVFELSKLQYDWWEWLMMQKIAAQLVTNLYGLIFMLIFGVILGVSFEQTFEQTFGLFCVLVLGLIIWLVSGLVSGLKEGTPWIETKDERKWSFKNYFHHLKKNLIMVLFPGLIFGLVKKQASELVIWIVIWFFFGLIEMLKEDFTNTLQITTPYQRFTASMKSLHFSILQHFHLRWILYRKGLLPLHLVDFLNEMTERHILESDGAVFDNNGKIIKSGATWRFRHRILQEYFANQLVEPEAENKQGE